MKKQEQTTSDSRRAFLRNAAGTGACVALAAALPGAAAAVSTEEAGQADAGKSGYRLTQHVLDYYKSAAF